MASETREVYRGQAVIMGVSFEGVEDWMEWERRDLSDVDKTNAFKIVYDVAEGDANGRRHDVKIECSHRELKGKMLDYYQREDGTPPTQMDVALRSLKQQGLLDKGDTESALVKAVDDALCGRMVTIRAYEELGKDGVKWWPRCVFASKYQRLTGDDKNARLQAFLSGKPAPVAIANVPTAAAAALPSAPADDGDLDDLPF